MSQFSSSAVQTLKARDLAAIATLRDYRQVRSMPEIWPLAAERYGDRPAMNDSHNQPQATLTYRQLGDTIQRFAAGLQSLGMAAGSHIALFADNSHRWFIADQGIMAAGGVDAVRSAQADTEELCYIAEHSDSTVLVLQDLALWRRLRDRCQRLPIELVVLLSDEATDPEAAVKMMNFSELLALGRQRALSPVAIAPNDLASLIYTSGTTGKPKGVMMTHANLLHQINTLGAVVQPRPGDRVLGLLPTWHTFGRTAEYFLYAQGCTQTYTNIRAFKDDLRRVRPHYMVGVPRLWESVYDAIHKQFREQPANKQRLINTLLFLSKTYVQNRRMFQSLNLESPHVNPLYRGLAGLCSLLLWPVHRLGEVLVYGKVREAIGGCIKALISGGGALPRHIDLFFEVINVPVLVGYGLTETAPVLSARRPWRNLRGASGQPIPDTELCVVDPETRQPLPQGHKGLVLARGPQIMKGYYKNPEATAKAINREGWFDTGDLGWLTSDGNIVLTGRAKDTIVLTNGENIEPLPIENACACSPYIDQIMLVGQDQRSLGALIVPNLDALKQWAASQGLTLQLPEDPNPDGDPQSLVSLEDESIQRLFRTELNQRVKERPSYRPDDRIGPFRLLQEPFSMENGMLTQTLKIRRPVVYERYRDMIDGMFA